MTTSSAAGQSVAWAPLAAMILVCLPALAAGQEPVRSFDQLNTRLKVGDTVWVTDAQGREVKGRITSLGSETMGVDAHGDRALQASEVRAVELRRPDSLANGALIGLGAGFGAGVLLAAGGCSEADCSWGEASLVALLIAAVGTGIGVGVDALIPGRKQVVYRAPGAPGNARLSLAPFVSSRAKGVAVSYSF